MQVNVWMFLEHWVSLSDLIVWVSSSSTRYITVFWCQSNRSFYYLASFPHLIVPFCVILLKCVCVCVCVCVCCIIALLATGQPLNHSLCLSEKESHLNGHSRLYCSHKTYHRLSVNESAFEPFFKLLH